jgi:hypothetical protein
MMAYLEVYDDDDHHHHRRRRRRNNNNNNNNIEIGEITTMARSSCNLRICLQLDNTPNSSTYPTEKILKRNYSADKSTAC